MHVVAIYSIPIMCQIMESRNGCFYIVGGTTRRAFDFL